MYNQLLKLAREHRLAVSAFLILFFGSLYNFFTTYEVTLKEYSTPTPAVVITETRTPKSTRLEIPSIPEDVPEKKFRAVVPTDMAHPSSWAYYIRDPILAAIRASDFDIVVTDIGDKNKFTRADVMAMKSGGKAILAYASLGEAEKFRKYWRWNNSMPVWIGKEHKLWKGVYTVRDLMNQEWLEIVKKQLVSYMDAGFDGILIAGLSGDHVKEFLEYVKDFVSERNAKFRLFVQDYIEPDALPYIDGVVKQNLLYYYGTSKYKNATVEDIVKKLKQFKEAGKIVLIVSYTRGAEWKEVKETATKNGFVPYSAPLKLDVLRFDQG